MSDVSTPAPIEPEDRDWTSVITDGCPECGFRPHDARRTGSLLRATLPAWQAALARPDASQRPAPTVWSAVEYGCHARDVCALFRQRLDLMLNHDHPTFANWDQDATAVESDYFHQRAADVWTQLQHQAEATASAFDAVSDGEWQRSGRRSNGAEFTIETFAIYFLHDVVHHVHDVAH